MSEKWVNVKRSLFAFKGSLRVNRKVVCDFRYAIVNISSIMFQRNLLPIQSAIIAIDELRRKGYHILTGPTHSS